VVRARRLALVSRKWPGSILGPAGAYEDWVCLSLVLTLAARFVFSGFFCCPPFRKATRARLLKYHSIWEQWTNVHSVDYHIPIFFSNFHLSLLFILAGNAPAASWSHGPQRGGVQNRVWNETCYCGLPSWRSPEQDLKKEIRQSGVWLEWSLRPLQGTTSTQESTRFVLVQIAWIDSCGIC